LCDSLLHLPSLFALSDIYVHISDSRSHIGIINRCNTHDNKRILFITSDKLPVI